MNYYNLSNDDIISRAPSTAAIEPASDVSKKYSFVSTIDAVDLIRQAGWTPYYAHQQKTRKGSPHSGFQRHIVKFTMGDELLPGGGERMDLVLLNSHNRSSAFKLALGIFRHACSNGLVVGDIAMSYTHLHLNFDYQGFLDSVKRLESCGPALASKVSDYKQIELTPNEQGVFAKSAATLLSNNPEEINTLSLLAHRRYSDRGSDLWTTFNRVQENVIRGGVQRFGKTKKGLPKRRTKGIKSVERDTKINKALWTLTDEMAKLKQG